MAEATLPQPDYEGWRDAMINITARLDGFTAGMKRAIAAMKRFTKVARRAQRVQNREESGYWRGRSSMQPRFARPTLRARDCRWSQTR